MQPNRREPGAETHSGNQPKPKDNATEVHPVTAFVRNMKADSLTREEMIEGVIDEFDVPRDIADAWVNKEMPAEKRSILEIFKSKPDERKSFTAEGYEVKPGESEAVHLMVEQVTYDGRGKRLSKPRLIKIDVVDWKDWSDRKGGQGFDFIEVKHRPATIAPIQVDDWEETEVDGKMVGTNKGEFF